MARRRTAGAEVPSLPDLIRGDPAALKKLKALSDLQLYEFTQQIQDSLRGLGAARGLPQTPESFALKFSRNNWHSARHLRYLSDRLVALEKRQIKRLLISMPPRHGKQLAHSTPVPTPSGWKAHGDLQVGDLVLGRDGQAYPVLAVGPESAEDDVRLTFSDGSSVICHEDHEWVVFDRSWRKERTVETRYLLARKLETGPESGRGHRYQIQLPPIAPVWGPVKDLPVPPYVLGAWLGDGKSNAGVIAHHDDDRFVVEQIARTYPVQNVYLNRTYPRVSQTLFRGLLPALRSAGVVKNKHIPLSYLTACEEQRRALLAGLIDTDGSVGSDGRVRFSNTNPRLVEDVRHLICSLGYRASVVEVAPILSTSGVQGKKKVYQVCFTPHDREAALMPRKQRGVLGTQRRIAVVKAERVSPERGKCIQTAAPDGVYLFGRSYLPTHNSFLVDQFFPAWWLARHPKDRVMLVGYNESFAREWGGKVRDLILENSEDFNLLVNKDRTAADDWALTSGGGMISVGVGGSLMGRGADLLIFDDVVKEIQEVESDTQREKVWQWFLTSPMTRLQPNAVIVGVMTRWHQDDLFGRIIANMPDWEVINIPAVATSDSDPLGRSKGEGLWPEFWGGQDYYTKLEASTHPSVWSSLYQGNPSIAGGGEIRGEWFRWWHPDDLPEFDMMIQSWDLSLKDQETNDYSVGQVWGRRQGSLYLLASTRGHMNLDAVCKAMRQFAIQFPKAVGKLVEDAAMGPLVKQVLHHSVPGIIPITPQGSKLGRVRACAPLLMAGNVYLPERKDSTKDRWVWDFVTECEGFPKAAYDDQVDAMTQAITFLTPGIYTDARRAAHAAANDAIPVATPSELRAKFWEHLTDKTMKDADRKFNRPGQATSLTRLLRPTRLW